MTETDPSTTSPTTAPVHDLRETVEERKATGKLARKRAPRGALARWDETSRGHDALETIVAQNAIRDPGLLPVRHGRMVASPWNYYRGAAAVMAADLASRPHSGLLVQLCGDAHVLNFGLWATPERNLMFDLRDFDETLPGPFEWDVQRLAASLVVAAREDGLKAATADEAVITAVEAYRDRMARCARMSELSLWYDGTHVDSLISYFTPADRELIAVHIEKESRSRTHLGAFAKLTSMVDGRPRIDEDPPFRFAIDDEEQDALTDQFLAGYRMTLREDRRFLFDRFTPVDVVRQVVGVGSVGMRVYLVLLEGRSGSDPLFLQIKQAGPSAYESCLGRSQHDNHGARVISGKRALQTATGIFVGWGSFRGRDYYVRQFRDMKIILDIKLLAPCLVEFAAACGETLARAHARSGDAVAISAYLGKGSQFATALRDFARLYADQNERDHAQLQRAIAAGTVASAPGW
ncbi:MAG: hypothetical protein FAZ92_02273 [Accumulibacter sp.]|uniref:DUF2252 domain-containing protein n=1 Tax=Accumulibacter sp. TaxID=2053492 RepID=UPI00122A900E|nr:DUF2252 domain-containing protein [Accumulibacter sp.]TLD45460.1 MAG: hypothetical protein FAZ92_02273 [Accumulibacter sp.]